MTDFVYTQQNTVLNVKLSLRITPRIQVFDIFRYD